MIEGDTVTLSEQQRRSLDAAAQWVTAARAEVGNAYLRVQDLERELAKARADLELAAARAEEQETQHANIMLAVSNELNLPHGEWRYDAGKMRLVRKEHSDA